MTDHSPEKQTDEMDTRPPASKFPWGAVIGIVVLALVGFAMLAYAIFSLLGSSGSPRPTQVSLRPTLIVIIPTTTPAPSVPPTLPPTLAPPAETQVEVATPTQPPPTTEPTLTIVQPANIRTGPGLMYPVIGGLAAGATAPVIGRDASAQWYVIQYAASTSGQGWVSHVVSTYNGDVNGLPVIAAPPTPLPPPPTNTPVPPTSPPTNPPPTSAPASYSSQGIVGNEFSIRSTTVSVGQDIWFHFKVTNTTDNDVHLSILTIHADGGPSGRSYTNYTLKAHQALPWDDHFKITTAGTYQLYLGICYGSTDACIANQAQWDHLSPSITVVVQ